MPSQLEDDLARWLAAGLLTPEAAERIRRFEAARDGEGQSRLRWPVLVALGAGALMLGAGVLLFVSAHWDGLSQQAQFALVLLMVALFHAAAAAVGDRFEAMTSALHALGTAALGAGIFLTARIFNLESDWPNGVLLWSLGAGAAWYLRRQWTQVAFLAILLPTWLVGRWLVDTENRSFAHSRVPLAGLLLLALSYLWAESADAQNSTRRLLRFLGALTVIPFGIATGVFGSEDYFRSLPSAGDRAIELFGWLLFLGIPLLLGWVLRRKDAWPLLVAALWVWVGSHLPVHVELPPFIWGATGALGLVAAGIRDRSILRLNLGVVAFAITVLLFYFSSVMDKLGRAESLILGGAIFLVGGWGLERLRRRLVASLGPREAAG